MKHHLLVISVMLMGTVSGSLGAYIIGRILLPEMGLRAPHYGTWLAISLVAIPFYLLNGFLEGLVGER